MVYLQLLMLMQVLLQHLNLTLAIPHSQSHLATQMITDMETLNTHHPQAI